MNKKGSITIESALVVPFVIFFISLLLSLNIRFFNLLKIENEEPNDIDYVNFHREISSIFDAGGNIYEMLFGE